MGGWRQMTTTRGYDLLEVVSAMQKAIRRGDATLAGYWATELYESGYTEYLWRRLLIVSAEDIFAPITREVLALRDAHLLVNARRKRGEPWQCGLFPVKAAMLLALAPKSRDADHMICVVYERRLVPDAELEASIADARAEVIEIPEYALDCHTARGKRAGRTREQFIREEHAALSPRQPGLFDALVELPEPKAAP